MYVSAVCISTTIINLLLVFDLSLVPLEFSSLQELIYS